MSRGYCIINEDMGLGSMEALGVHKKLTALW